MAIVKYMEGISRGRLFIGTLKLLSLPETIRSSSPVHTHSCAGLGVTRHLVRADPCIAPINSLPLPIQQFDPIK
jgi:hypothetical protein